MDLKVNEPLYFCSTGHDPTDLYMGGSGYNRLRFGELPPNRSEINLSYRKLRLLLALSSYILPRRSFDFCDSCTPADLPYGSFRDVFVEQEVENIKDIITKNNGYKCGENCFLPPELRAFQCLWRQIDIKVFKIPKIGFVVTKVSHLSLNVGDMYISQHFYNDCRFPSQREIINYIIVKNDFELSDGEIGAGFLKVVGLYIPNMDSTYSNLMSMMGIDNYFDVVPKWFISMCNLKNSNKMLLFPSSLHDTL